MNVKAHHVRRTLLTVGAAALLVACEADAPDLPEPPPDQDGGVEQPDPADAADEIEIDPEELETE